MEFKKLFLVSIILLAILTLGSVSASDIDDGLAVDDSGDDLEISSVDSNVIYENGGDLVADESSDSSDSADSSDLILKDDGNSKALSNSALSDENSTILDENSTVIKSPTILEVSAENIYYYGDDCIVSISLKDEMNRPIDGTVEISLDGNTYQVIMDGDGSGQLAFNDLNVGTYVISANYLGDEYHNAAMASVTFEVIEEEQDDESPLYINEGLISFREVVGLDIGNSTSGTLLVMDADTNQILFQKNKIHTWNPVKCGWNNSYLFVTQFSVQGSGCCVSRIGINTKLWQVMLLCPLFIESHKSAAISFSGRLRRYDKRVQDTDGLRIELPGRTGINIHLDFVYDR